MMIFYIILWITLYTFSNNWVAINQPKLCVIHTDGGTAFQRAVVFTDSAADTYISYHRGALYGAYLPARIDHLGFFQPDRFLWGGAHLLAYDARTPRLPMADSGSDRCWLYRSPPTVSLPARASGWLRLGIPGHRQCSHNHSTPRVAPPAGSISLPALPL